MPVDDPIGNRKNPATRWKTQDRHAAWRQDKYAGSKQPLNEIPARWCFTVRLRERALPIVAIQPKGCARCGSSYLYPLWLFGPSPCSTPPGSKSVRPRNGLKLPKGKGRHGRRSLAACQQQEPISPPVLWYSSAGA